MKGQFMDVMVKVCIGQRTHLAGPIKVRETKNYFIEDDGTRYKKVSGGWYFASLTTGDRWNKTRKYLIEEGGEIHLEMAEERLKMLYTQLVKSEIFEINRELNKSKRDDFDMVLKVGKLLGIKSFEDFKAESKTNG